MGLTGRQSSMRTLYLLAIARARALPLNVVPAADDLETSRLSDLVWEAAMDGFDHHSAAIDSALSTAMAALSDQACAPQCLAAAASAAASAGPAPMQLCLQCVEEQELRLDLEPSWLTGTMAKDADGQLRTFCSGTNSSTGWERQPDGSYSGCEVAEHTPDAATTAFMSNAVVRRKLRDLPSGTHNGSIWRGNELGSHILVRDFWTGIAPASILLGAKPEQHRVLRPILDRLYGWSRHCPAHSQCQAARSAAIRAHATQWLAGKTSLGGADYFEYTHIALFERTFPGKENPFSAAQMQFVQLLFLVQATFLIYLPVSIRERLLALLPDMLSGVWWHQQLSDAYRPMVEEIYGAELAEGDCSPSDCVDQLTSAIIDTILLAGGLSIPTALSNGLWVLLADTSRWDETFPQTVPAGVSPLLYFMETLRFLPPVGTFPFWSGDNVPPANDTRYPDYPSPAAHTYLNLRMALRDPNAWGPDAHQFSLRRPLASYKEYSVAFADAAADPTVAGGAMDRYCPGKQLSMDLGEAFFELLLSQRSEWCPDPAADTPAYSSRGFSVTKPGASFSVVRGLGRGAACVVPRWFEAEPCCAGLRCVGWAAGSGGSGAWALMDRFLPQFSPFSVDGTCVRDEEM